jgi:hypothetical protein
LKRADRVDASEFAFDLEHARHRHPASAFTEESRRAG